MRPWRIQPWRYPRSRNLAYISHSSAVCEANVSSQSENQLSAVNDDFCRGPISVTNETYWTRRIHKLCTVCRDVDAALHLLHLLSLRGCRPNSLNISSILHALCDANRFDEAHHRFAHFVYSHCSPDERTCNVLIARLLDGREPFWTLRVMNALAAEKPEFVPSLVNYNRLVDSFCKIGRLEVAHLILYHTIDRGHCLNVVSFTTLLDGYCGIGDVRSAEKLFDEMSEYGVKQNALSYCALFRGVLRKREFDYGNRWMGMIWEAMKREEAMQVNNAAFCSLVDSLCREGLFHELFKIAEDMPQGKNVLEEFAYGQMIYAMCTFERYNGAARIVYMMRKKGYIPTFVSYNSIIHGLCNDGDCLRAFQLLEEGMELGYIPSEFTYTVLVEGLCRELDLSKAKKVLDVMLSHETVEQNRIRIYNIYLRALCHINNPTELLNVLVMMLQSQCTPDVITLNTLIKAFCKMGRISEALQVFGDMTTGKFCAPDGVTFTTLIYELLNVGKVEEAVDFLQKAMNENHFSPGVVTYNAMLRGLFKLGRVSEAMEVFDSMVHCRVAADCITYTIIIDGLCEFFRIDEAKKFWENIVWPSGVHDNFVYASILKGLCRSEKYNEARDLLYELADCGVALNTVNYNIVVDYACRLGLKREAYQIVGEMKNNGLAPDAVTWRILDKLHENS
ncbi:uncharacterized protein [Primulina eburnea]|uniref:uncharacterized protein n=1 Tax=Primulina eburnea TaxID=1245227 RepID=UPI003C6C02AB